MPRIDPTAFIHPLAYVAGNVTLGARVSVWPTAVIRGDSDAITIGDDTNVQDGSVVHVDDGVPTTIGKRVAIGHRAIIHGSTVEDDCLIAMGAILLNGVRVGTGSIVGAGAMCPEGNADPAEFVGDRASGACRPCRRRTPSANGFERRWRSYVELQVQHRAGAFEQVGREGRRCFRRASGTRLPLGTARAMPRESKQGHHEMVTNNVTAARRNHAPGPDRCR